MTIYAVLLTIYAVLFERAAKKRPSVHKKGATYAYLASYVESEKEEDELVAYMLQDFRECYPIYFRD